MDKFSVLRSDDFTFAADLPFSGDSQAVVDWLKTQSNVSKYFIWSSESSRFFTVKNFLRDFGTPENHKNLVPKYYTMDPMTEDIVLGTELLANGMRVLINDSSKRYTFEDVNTCVESSKEMFEERLLTMSRWCTVSKLQVHTDNASVRFVGIYEDGTKRVRTYHRQEPWLVKIDSMSDVFNEEKDTKQYNAISKMISEAFVECEGLVARHDYPAEEITSLVEETTKKILGTLG